MCTHIYIHSYSTMKTMLDFEICKVQPVKTFNSLVSSFYICSYIATVCTLFINFVDKSNNTYNYLNIISERKHPTRKLYIPYDNNQRYNDVYNDYKMKNSCTYINVCSAIHLQYIICTHNYTCKNEHIQYNNFMQ